VKILTENYSQADGEGMYAAKADKIWLMQAGGRFKIGLS